MKKSLIALAAFMLSMAVYAQGTINFNTKVGSDPDFRFLLGSGAGASAGQGAGNDPSARAQLVLVSGTSTTPLTPITTFRTTSDAAEFYITAAEITVPGLAPAATGQFRVRAWIGAASYETADPLNRAESPLVSATAGGGNPPLPAGNLTGLVGSATIPVVPEPSTLALGIIGGLALLLRRRK